MQKAIESIPLTLSRDLEHGIGNCNYAFILTIVYEDKIGRYCYDYIYRELLHSVKSLSTKTFMGIELLKNAP